MARGVSRLAAFIGWGIVVDVALILIHNAG